MFQLKHLMLPHDGVIPGARGYKKQVIPAGTKVYCIVYGTLMYWACYQSEQQALKAMEGLQATIGGQSRRKIDITTLLQWNFSTRFPKKVVRMK